MSFASEEAETTVAKFIVSTVIEIDRTNETRSHLKGEINNNQDLLHARLNRIVEIDNAQQQFVIHEKGT